jgi:hypothetical protein
MSTLCVPEAVAEVETSTLGEPELMRTISPPAGAAGEAVMPVCICMSRPMSSVAVFRLTTLFVTVTWVDCGV